MKLDRATLSNGQYVTCTVRRADCTNLCFGWFSVWRSKRHFERGDCEYSIDIKSVPLGDNELHIQKTATEFINKCEDEWANDLNRMLAKTLPARYSRVKEIK